MSISCIYQQVDIGHGAKPPGYYIQQSSGLFPAPWPQDSTGLEQVCVWFRFLGTFLAKCLQDGRLVDVPLSQPMFKLLCQKRKALDLDQSSKEVGPLVCACNVCTVHKEDTHIIASGICFVPQESTAPQEYGDNVTVDTINEDDLNLGADNQLPNQLQEAGAVSAKEEMLTSDSLLLEAVTEDKYLELEKEITIEATAEEELLALPPSPELELSAEPCWFQSILDLEDLAVCAPHRARFLTELQRLAALRDQLMSNPVQSETERLASVNALRLLLDKNDKGEGVKLEDLW